MTDQIQDDDIKNDAKRHHHLRMRQELIEAKRKQEILQRQLAGVCVEYRATKELLKKSQLANSMLRRLFSEEREKKFHMWLNLLEYRQPGRLFSILRAAYRYLDSVTCIQHRVVCTELCAFTVENCTTVRMRHRGDASAAKLGKTGLIPFISSLSDLLEVSFAGFNNLGDAGLFCSFANHTKTQLGLQACHRLVALDLSRSKIGPRVASELGRHGRFPSLEILRLEGNDLYSEGLCGLFANGLGVRQLRFLYLPDNMLQQEPTEGKYCDKGLAALGQAMQSGGFSSLEVLDMSRNYVDDGGIHAFAQGLSRCTNLRVLRLEWGAPHAPQVSGFKQDGADSFKRRLMWRRLTGKHSERTQVRHGVSDQGAKELARVLKKIVLVQRDLVSSGEMESSPLEMVDLRAHRIGSDGCIALFDALFAVRVPGRSSVGSSGDHSTKKSRDSVSHSDTFRLNSRKFRRGSAGFPETEENGAEASVEPASLLLHGNPTIGEKVILPVAKSIGFRGESFHAQKLLREEFGIFEVHSYSENDQQNGSSSHEGRDARHHRHKDLADDFALQVRASLTRRRKCAELAAVARASVSRHDRYLQLAKRPRRQLLPPLNKQNTKDY